MPSPDSLAAFVRLGFQPLTYQSPSTSSNTSVDRRGRLLAARLAVRGVCRRRSATRSPPRLTRIAGFLEAMPELRAGMYLSLQAGMNSATSAVGANMLVMDTAQDLFRQLDALTQMVHRGVAGVAMVPITSVATPVHHLSFLRQAKVPLVAAVLCPLPPRRFCACSTRRIRMKLVARPLRRG